MSDPVNNPEDNKSIAAIEADAIPELLTYIHEYWKLYKKMQPGDSLDLRVVGATGHGVATVGLDDPVALQETDFNGYLLQWDPNMADLPIKILYDSIADTLYFFRTHNTQYVFLTPVSMIVTVGIRSAKNPETKKTLWDIAEGCELILMQARAFHKDNLESAAKNVPHQ